MRQSYPQTNNNKIKSDPTSNRNTHLRGQEKNSRNPVQYCKQHNLCPKIPGEKKLKRKSFPRKSPIPPIKKLAATKSKQSGNTIKQQKFQKYFSKFSKNIRHSTKQNLNY